MSKNKVTYEKKVEIVRDYLDGRVGYKESIQRANNSAASFRHWVHLYKGNGAAGLLPNSRNKVYLEDRIHAFMRFCAMTANTMYRHIKRADRCHHRSLPHADTSVGNVLEKATNVEADKPVNHQVCQAAFFHHDLYSAENFLRRLEEQHDLATEASLCSDNIFAAPNSMATCAS